MQCSFSTSSSSFNGALLGAPASSSSAVNRLSCGLACATSVVVSVKLKREIEQLSLRDCFDENLLRSLIRAVRDRPVKRCSRLARTTEPMLAKIFTAMLTIRPSQASNHELRRRTSTCFSSAGRHDKAAAPNSRLHASCCWKRYAGAPRFHVESVALDAVIAKAKPQNIGCFLPVTTTYSTNQYVMQERISGVEMRLRGHWTHPCVTQQRPTSDPPAAACTRRFNLACRAAA